MLAWVRSSDPNKPKRVLHFLKSLNDRFKLSEDSELKPTLLTYNNAMEACANCQGSSEEQTVALKIIFAINKAIIAAKMEPNHISYRILIKAATNLVPPGEERNAIVKALFDKCKNSGQVDKFVLKALQYADSTTFHACVVKSKTNNAIPTEWSRNVQ